MLVLLFSFMVFQLVVKEDSPMRAIDPVADYMVLKGRERAHDENECILARFTNNYLEKNLI